MALPKNGKIKMFQISQGLHTLGNKISKNVKKWVFLLLFAGYVCKNSSNGG
jgi:hypothetical protein